MSCPSPETPLPSASAERAPSLGHFSVWANTAWLDRTALPEVSDKGKKEKNQKQGVVLVGILQGSRTQRAVTSVGQLRKCLSFILEQKPLKVSWVKRESVSAGF